MLVWFDCVGYGLWLVLWWLLMYFGSVVFCIDGAWFC